MNYSQGKRFYVLKSSAASSILQFNNVSGRDAISSRRWFHAYYQGKERERDMCTRGKFVEGLSPSDLEIRSKPGTWAAVWNSSEIHSTNQIPLKPLNKLG